MVVEEFGLSYGGVVVMPSRYLCQDARDNGRIRGIREYVVEAYMVFKKHIETTARLREHKRRRLRYYYPHIGTRDASKVPERDAHERPLAEGNHKVAPPSPLQPQASTRHKTSHTNFLAHSQDATIHYG